MPEPDDTISKNKSTESGRQFWNHVENVAKQVRGGRGDDEQLVREKYPDVELSRAFATQKDKTRRWMWCAMSLLKSMTSRGRRNKLLNVGTWCFSEQDAWRSAADHVRKSISLHMFDEKGPE